MKLLVLAYADGTAASTTYRFRAGQSWWQSAGHQMDLWPVRSLPADCWTQAATYDAVIVQKALMNDQWRRRLLRLGPPVYFDFDDAIWTRPGKPYSAFTRWRVQRRCRHWLSSVAGVFTANNVLADFARQFTNRVTVLPMALDLGQWKPRPDPHDGIRIGWAGSPGNLRYLEQQRTALQTVLTRYPQARLAVLCGQQPDFDFTFDHVPYRPGAEVEFVQGLDIGLLPLPDEPYSRGKSPIKAIQYISCGIPVVGNIRGATAEILDATNSMAVSTDDQWPTAIGQLIQDTELRRRLGANGRARAEQHHNLSHTTRRLQRLLTGAEPWISPS